MAFLASTIINPNIQGYQHVTMTIEQRDKEEIKLELNGMRYYLFGAVS